MLLFTVLANLVVLQLGRGVVRADLEEAARAGSRTVASVEEALAVCRRTAARGRGLRPFTTQGEDVTIDCAAADGRVVVTARILLRGWLPGMPDHLVTERASAPREVLP